MEYQGFEIIGFSRQKSETVKWCFRALGILQQKISIMNLEGYNCKI